MSFIVSSPCHLGRLAIIRRMTKSSTQSGYAIDRNYFLVEFSDASSLFYYNTAGWCGSDGSEGQLRLTFQTMEDALRYVRDDLRCDYMVQNNCSGQIKPKSYASNFAV